MSDDPSSQSDRTDSPVMSILLAHGVVPTRQRLEIAALVLERPQHLSAERVLARLRANGRQVSKATVYNTLGLFRQKGLVREVIVDPQRVFYDSNTAPHHHLYEVDTGCLHDIDPVAVSVGPLPSLPPEAEVEGVEVVIRVRRRPAARDASGA